MRSLTRTSRPDVLTTHAAAWSAAFVSSQDRRPPSGRYGHPEVRQRLRATSHDKCFYCERVLLDGEDEVDHYIEVSERRDLAFEWSNLYLACKDCNNGKPPNTVIPVASCVDPCAPVTAPEAHLTFIEDRAVAIDGSPQGLQTIHKYRLNDLKHLYARSTMLRRFYKELSRIRGECARDGRAMTAPEQGYLRGLAGPTQPYAQMIAAALRLEGL